MNPKTRLIEQCIQTCSPSAAILCKTRRFKGDVTA
jgi:hypothetical protein